MDDNRIQRVYNQPPEGAGQPYASIYVDTVTGVQYLFFESGPRSGLTPLLDRDGKPLLFEQ